MIDLHNHLLVGLDDGSRSVEQSLAALARFREEGVREVVCTPHVAASEIAIGGEGHIARRDQALAALRARAPEIALHPGFEIMLDVPLPPDALSDRRYALAGSRYYLVEFPLRVAGDLTVRVLTPLAAAGVVPVVAHPERYAGCRTETVRAWRDAGCAVQVDATTLSRQSLRGAWARRYVEAGLADVLAGDNHGDRRGLWVGRDYLMARGGAAGARAATVLVADNPGHVVADRPLEPVPTVALRRTAIERLRELW